VRRTLPITVAAVVLSLLGALAVAVPATSAPQDPRGSRGLFVDPLMKAAQAGPAFSAIGARAQPLWITDYYGSPEGARDATARFVGRAAEVGKTPLLVVYNIPDRDCGLYSSQDDQITDAYYRSWVKQVAAGIGSSKPIVVAAATGWRCSSTPPACCRRPARGSTSTPATPAGARRSTWPRSS